MRLLWDWLAPLPIGLTGTVSELEAQVGAPEAVYGNGQLDHLVPAGAVVVVEHERAILAGVGLATAQADAVLRGQESICLSSFAKFLPCICDGRNNYSAHKVARGVP